MTSQPDTRRMSASEVRQKFSEVVNSVAQGEGRVIVEKNGMPAVAIVSLTEAGSAPSQPDPVREAELARRRQIVEELRSFFGQFPQDELQQAIDDSVAEAKRELREERLARKVAESSIEYGTERPSQ